MTPGDVELGAQIGFLHFMVGAARQIVEADLAHHDHPIRCRHAVKFFQVAGRQLPVDVGRVYADSGKHAAMLVGQTDAVLRTFNGRAGNDKRVHSGGNSPVQYYGKLRPSVLVHVGMYVNQQGS